jgi:hypothetical protein
MDGFLKERNWVMSEMDRSIRENEVAPWRDGLIHEPDGSTHERDGSVRQGE